MGQQVLQLLRGQSGLVLASAADGPATAGVGSKIESTDIVVENDLPSALGKAQVYIDFTSPAASAAAAKAALQNKTAAVVGTTGLDEGADEALRELAKVAPVLVASNFSPGVALLMHLAEKAAAALGPEYDLEVVELHHSKKVDAPSGTALSLGKALAKGRGIDFESARNCSREGQVGPRGEGEIGILALRGGDIVGEHTAYFVGSEERLEITHRAQKRSVFAAGALRAARWVAEQPPGRYSMADLLGI